MSTEVKSSHTDVYGGVHWSAVSAWGQQGVQLVVSVVLARLLLPQDYGLLAMATVFVGFLAIFTSMGFGQVVIQRRELSDALLSSLYYVTLAIGGLLAIITAVAAPACAWIYRDPQVMPVMIVLGISFLISAPGIIPSALLNRQMRFGRLAAGELAGVVIGGAVAITLAANGRGVWALVAGSLMGTAVGTVLFHVLSQWRPKLRFCRSEVGSVFRFGANMTGFGIFNYFARNADNFIIGAFLGAGPLGYYALAYGILLKPREAVTNVLMRVLYPAFSRMQDDDARLRAAYLRACGAIAFVTFPMMLGLAAVADPFVSVVLGTRWLPAVPLILVLAPLGALQSVWVPIGTIFLVKDRTDWYFRMGVAQGCLTVAAFLAGIPWGTLGVAVAYAVINLLWIPVWLWLGSSLIAGLRAKDFFKELLPYGLLSLAMCLVVVLCRQMLIAAGAATPFVLGICVAVGIVVYVGAALVTGPVALADFAKILPGGPRRWVIKFRRRGTSALDNTGGP
jgi:O-antigen/teichoic acid export membrane protein